MITIYSKDNCQKCVSTKRAFDKRGVEYQEVQVDTESDLMNTLKNEGHQSFPVVTTDTITWSDFRPDLIAKVTS